MAECDRVSELLSQADFLMDSGETEEAIGLLEEALQVAPNNKILKKIAQSSQRLYNHLLARDKYNEALESLVKLLPANLKDWSSLKGCYQTLANIFDSPNQYDKSLLLFKILRDSQPQNPVFWARCAILLFKTDQVQESYQHFEESLKLNPNNNKTLSSYANALLSKGQSKKSLGFFERSLELKPDNFKTLTRYASALIKENQCNKALDFLKKAIKIQPQDARTLGNYGKALANTKQFDRACEQFEQSLQLKFNSYYALQYARVLEHLGRYEEAIAQLKRIDIDKLPVYRANVICLHLGRLYYCIRQPDKGNEYFDIALANSDDKERTLLYSARSILANQPYSQTAVEMLKQIERESDRYDQAWEMLALNLKEEEYFNMVKTDYKSNIDDTEMLNRTIYHKIANEISILKSIAYKIVHFSPEEDTLFDSIIEYIENIFIEVDRRRKNQQTQIETIPQKDYQKVIEIISKTAHDISDFVNNELAVIESKTRRAMLRLNSDSHQYSQLEKLLAQLELTQSALRDLKAINEGIKIKNSRFKIKNLFEKWIENPKIDSATITIETTNPEQEFNGDEEKIKSILNELVENSLKHNKNQVNLQIKISSEDIVNPPKIRWFRIPGEQKFLLITFSDNGEGIPEDKKEWIFKPLKTTSKEEKGSGLGLFIIRKTLEKMNGYIQETGFHGARFEIYIPYNSN